MRVDAVRIIEGEEGEDNDAAVAAVRRRGRAGGRTLPDSVANNGRGAGRTRGGNARLGSRGTAVRRRNVRTARTQGGNRGRDPVGFVNGLGGAPAAPPARAADQDFRFFCYSVTFADKADMETGGKMLLPATVLGALMGPRGTATLGAGAPMVFQVRACPG